MPLALINAFDDWNVPVVIYSAPLKTNGVIMAVWIHLYSLPEVLAMPGSKKRRIHRFCFDSTGYTV
jgi:hypothetical protein